MKNGKLKHKRTSLSIVNYQLSIIFTLFLLNCALLSSCKKETSDPVQVMEDYFPMQKGIYIVYNVDSVVYTSATTLTKYRFQLKDVLDSTFIDGTGKKRTILVRYHRADSTQSWVLRSVWTQQLTGTAAYRWEDNIPYHKLAFPITTRIEWNGNDMNTMEKEMYKYTSIHKPYQLFPGGGDPPTPYFDSTVTVRQVNDENFIEKRFGEEVYATHVGLIYKQRDELTKTSGQITSGLEYKMIVVEWGRQ